jgi:hypothetical protein
MTKKRSIKRTIFSIAIIVFIIMLTCSIFIYINLNRLLTNALHNGFDANIISDVYELKFEDLDVNIVTGSVKVLNVEMSPREKPLHDYPYINSSFRLEAKKMNLKNVSLVKLIRTNKLDLEKIELVEPGIDFTISDSITVFFPYTSSVADSTTKAGKKSLESYFLKEFSMVDAFFHVSNSAKRREFNIERINISLKDILISRQPDRDVVTYRHFDFSIGELTGNLKNKKLQYIHFKDFTINIDSLHFEETPDTVIYRFTDFGLGIRNLDMQTEDSIYHLTMESFKVNYKANSVEFNQFSAKPNISDAAMQKRFKYRKEHFAANIGSLRLQGVNFDSLIYARKFFIDKVLLDDVSAAIYKDLTKPFPPDHHPKYLGQQFQSMGMPLLIKQVKATHVNLVNTEVLPDGVTIGKANINRATLEIDNLTSMPSNDKLTIKAEAFIENKARANVTLKFNYDQPLFTFSAKLDKFDLTDLNSLTNSYTPARISKGIADGITLFGTVNESQSNGTMTFLYHDLAIKLLLEDKAKWKSTVLGFAANTILVSANPASPDLPVREVKFEVIRDPRKGFMNMIIKSILDGLKETFMMSKENKQAYKEAKSVSKEKAKVEKKKGE